MPHQIPAPGRHDDDSEYSLDSAPTARQDTFVRIRRPLNPGEQVPPIPTLAQLVGVFTAQLASRANSAASAKRVRKAKAPRTV